MAGFKTIKYYNGSYVEYTMEEHLSDEDFEKFLSSLDSLLLLENPFVFLVDTRPLKKFNRINSGMKILKWMKKNKVAIKKFLKGSSIIMSNQRIINILNWVFERQKPVSPNLICKEKLIGQNFLMNLIPDKIKNVVEST